MTDHFGPRVARRYAQRPDQDRVSPAESAFAARMHRPAKSAFSDCIKALSVHNSLIPSRFTHSRDLAGKRVWYLLKLFLVLQPQNGADQ